MQGAIILLHPGTTLRSAEKVLQMCCPSHSRTAWHAARTQACARSPRSRTSHANMAGQCHAAGLRYQGHLQVRKATAAVQTACRIMTPARRSRVWPSDTDLLHTGKDSRSLHSPGVGSCHHVPTVATQVHACTCVDAHLLALLAHVPLSDPLPVSTGASCAVWHGDCAW